VTPAAGTASTRLRGGIDLGGTKIQAVVVDPRNTVVGQARLPTPKDGGAEGVIAAMAEALRQAVEGRGGVEASALAGVGVGSPGTIDVEAGTVAHARNVVPEWDAPVPVAALLGAEVGAPVLLGNDVRVATIAEFELGAGVPYRSILGVFWGTGVGGGVILDGVPWSGRGAAGEIGHMVVKRGGARCTCGRVGCLEAYAGRRAMELEARRRVKAGHHTSLFRIMEERGRAQLSSGVWERALRKGDQLATKLIDRAVEALGAGVASAVNLLDVEAVVVGGGLGTRLGAPYVERISAAMQPHLFVDERPPAVHVASLGDVGGAIGATLLVPARAVGRRSDAAPA
jgi:glucokinase